MALGPGVGCHFEPEPLGWPGEDLTDAFRAPGDDGGVAGGEDAGGSAGSPDATPMTGLYAVTWNGVNWFARGNLENALAGYPRFEGSEVILTPDTTSRSAVLFMADTLTPPFIIEFDYRTNDPDGCPGTPCVLNSASGLVFMFGKELAPYAGEDPPSGDARGFITGRGVGVHVELFSQRLVSVRNSYLEALKSAEVETFSPEYRHVMIDVHSTGLDVYLDGYLVLNYLPSMTWSTAFHYVGFGAATGTVSTEQRIRDVIVY